MELLAPAGNIENFFAALHAGADAVYAGAPGLNARNLARDLTLEELGAMIDHCRNLGKKLYIAANSLVLEKELDRVVEQLAVLERLGPDALIVQDLGLLNLITRFFPGLKIHASTLMAAHNLQSVELLSRLGCERVVLARELTLEEIMGVSVKSDVQLEIFVHGAMCFSYSGLCLFSSYLGGKSGLRGRCVQPCRRAYQQQGAARGNKGRGGGKGQYLFSMNDLDGLEAVLALREAGVASLKIEGRLRSAHYVEKVVTGYRTLLDAPDDGREQALVEARDFIGQAMSRKVSSGYFFTPRPDDVIMAHHSGNMGLHIGRSAVFGKKGGNALLKVKVKEQLGLGDRLRVHLEPSGERYSFTLKHMMRADEQISRARVGESVEIGLPTEIFDQKWKVLDIYKVDVAQKSIATNRLDTRNMHQAIVGFRRKAAGKIQTLKMRVCPVDYYQEQLSPTKSARKGKGRTAPGRKREQVIKLPIEWWLKTGSVKPILERSALRPDRYILTFDKKNFQEAGQLKRQLGKQVRNITWSLPPILLDRDLPRVKKQLTLLMRSGFRCFQLSHISQIELFAGQKVFLSGDFPLNLLNSQALLMAAEAGLESAQLAIESDREAIATAIRGYKQLGLPASKRSGGRRDMRVGLTAYGTPPLFTARLDAPFFHYGKSVTSPKNEKFIIRKREGFTQTHPVAPFSLIPYLHELRSLGLDYVVMDLTGGNSGKRELEELAERLSGAGRQSKLATFNYLGKLL